MIHMVVGLGAVGLSTVAVFGYLVFIWWLDRYEREPFWLVLLSFVWGGIGGTTLGCLFSVTMSLPLEMVVPGAYSELVLAVVTAPLAEEFTKGLIFVALVLTPYLDNETDGLIYGAAAGLGFAGIENIFYFLSTAGDPEVFYPTVAVRTLFTATMHAVSTALFGYAVGYIRHRELWPRRWLWPFVGFALAVVNHGLWNLLVHVSGSPLLSERMTDEAMGLGMVFVFLMSAAMFVITQLSLMREQKIIGAYLDEEADRGTLPEAHADIIPSWRRRRRDGWVPDGLDREKYVEAATMLAFRRYQSETAADRYESEYRREVREYRRRVRELLEERDGTERRD